MKKNYLLAIFCALFASISLAAPTKPQKLSLILDWLPNPDHAPLIIAQQLGYFKQQGLDIELITPADPTDPAKLVAAGKADIAITYEPDFMEQVDRGLPLITIGVLIDKPLNCLVALKNGNISSLQDLKGKRIGLSSAGISGTMLKVLLQKHGLKESDVELVNVRYNLTQALLTKKVDMVAGLMRNVEVPSLEHNQQKLEIFFPEESGIPTYNELIFVTHVANKTDPRNKRFLHAIHQAIAWLDLHPKEGWELFIKHYPEANNAMNKEAWFATLPYFAEEPTALNKIEWQRFSKFMADNKLINKPQSITNYIVRM